MRPNMNVKTVGIDTITPYPRNAKAHPREQIEKIANSIREFGFNQPIVVDENNVVVVGHGRLEAARVLDMFEVPVLKVKLSEDQARAYRLADNKLNESKWEMDLVMDELRELSVPMIELTGFDPSILDAVDTSVKGSLADRFIAPPFSVLDTKQGYWQDRRRAWLALGLRSEVGRSEGLIGSGSADSMLGSINAGTSVFDPVLCEIAYSWFNVPQGTVLDPFAGGSVRGVIASKLGQQYVGHELRAEQVKANREQAELMCEDPVPVWVEGDSNVTLDAQDVKADLVFSCPPYADLEVYSTDPADISNMEYEDFMTVYRSIIAKACAKLKQDRFAVWVIGEVRNGKGIYYNFLGDTIKAFTDLGMQYYNEIILVNAIGTLPLRAGRQFSAGRKVGKMHQNVLVFYKGDTSKIKANYPAIDFTDITRLLEGEADELSTGPEPED